MRSFAVIVDKRAKAPRRCLACDRTFLTTADKRLCKACSSLVRDAQVGALVPASLLVLRIEHDTNA